MTIAYPRGEIQYFIELKIDGLNFKPSDDHKNGMRIDFYPEVVTPSNGTASIKGETRFKINSPTFRILSITTPEAQLTPHDTKFISDARTLIVPLIQFKAGKITGLGAAGGKKPSEVFSMEFPEGGLVRAVNYENGVYQLEFTLSVRVFAGIESLTQRNPKGNQPPEYLCTTANLDYIGAHFLG